MEPSIAQQDSTSQTEQIPADRPRRLVLLGASGSIGVSTLRVIEHLNQISAARYEIIGLAANGDHRALAQQADRCNVRHLALADRDAASALRSALPNAEIHEGVDAAEKLVHALADQTDLVLGAIVGIAGLRGSVAALEHGIDLALANKETLVAAGSFVTALARRTGAHILPIDSEHSAIWQALQTPGCLREAHACLPPCDVRNDVRRIVLTASGGSLRKTPAADVRSATVEQVLNHPTWNMGAKVTVDSASLTNKALEIIEAHHLFGLPGNQIDAVIHPQSIVHSLVEYHDGSMIAQLGTPDMTTPIQYALTYPDRPAGVAERLDIAAAGQLHFEQPNLARFPALGLAYDVLDAEGSTAGAIFNAANEAAVEAFLQGRIRFGDITALTAESLSAVPMHPLTCLDDVFDADRAAREFVVRKLSAATSARQAL